MMQYVRKMALVDPKTIAPVPKDASVRAMTRLDHEMMQVLERDDLGEAEKVKLYQQVLHKYLVYDKKETTSPPTEEQHMPNQPMSMEEAIVQSVPQSMQTKAKLLLDQSRGKGK